MIVLTFPRSGSSYLARAIDHFLREHKGQSVNLMEFTNTACPETWGNLLQQRRDMRQGQQQIMTTLALKQTIDWASLTHLGDLLEPHALAVSSEDQVEQFITQEHSRRMAAVAEMRSRGIDHVIKHFPESGSCRSIDLELDHCVFLYRKDLRACLLSMMIQRQHYALEPKHHHNYANRPAPPILEPLALDQETVRYHLEIFCRLLKLLDQSQEWARLSHEDMLAGATIKLAGHVINPRAITEKYIPRPEQAMDYSLTGSKEAFFTDSACLPGLIEEALTRAGLEPTAKQLGIHW